MTNIEKAFANFDRKFTISLVDKYREEISHRLYEMGRGAADAGFYNASVVYTNAFHNVNEGISYLSPVHELLLSAEHDYKNRSDDMGVRYEQEAAIKNLIELVANFYCKAEQSVA